mmetsp:Transcript_12289/g.11914  ORF Transcript_12289/g.11914 Transcript_12289/m.11914 type:complete len:538 (+) Transcript_12289:99-1712(+)
MEDDNEDSDGEVSDESYGREIITKGKDSHARTIIHLDVDCFYATVEIILNPELRGKPIGIQQKHLLVTCSYEARAMGVEKCMSMVKALEICPNIIIINGENLYKYREMSEAIYSILQDYTPLVEKLGLDENWLDISALVAVTSDNINVNHDNNKLVGHLYGDMNTGERRCCCGCVERITKASAIAQDIRDRLKSELGITCSAGISYNKILSKLVGSEHKPNQQSSIFSCSALDFIQSKALKHLPGIGQATKAKLGSMGLDTVNKVRQANELTLEKFLGAKLAKFVLQLCHGIDDSPVRLTSQPKSIGIEDGFRAVTTIPEIIEKIRIVLQRLWILVAKDGRIPSQMKVTIRRLTFKSEHPSERTSRILSFDPSLLFHRNKAKELALCEENKIVAYAMELFGRLTDNLEKGWHITLIGISFSNFGINSDSSLVSRGGTSIDQYLSSSNKNAEKPTPLISSDVEPTSKKARSEECMNSPMQVQNQNIDTNLRRCPEGLDPKVFSELPTDIQLEIISNQKKPSKTVTKAKTIQSYFSSRK